MMETVLALAAIVVGTVTTYHIAVRQGVFRRSRVLLTIANPIQPRNAALTRLFPILSRPPYLVVFGVPSDATDTFVVTLPISIRNSGRAAAQGVTLQTVVSPELFPDRIFTLEAEGTHADKGDCEVSRRFDASGGFITYEWPVFAPYRHDCMIEHLCFDASTVNAIPVQGGHQIPLVFAIRFHLANCHSYRDRIVLVAACVLDDEAVLVHAVSSIAQHAFKLHPPQVSQAVRSVAALLRIPCDGILYVQPDFRRVAEGVMLQAYGQPDDKTSCRILDLIPRKVR
jgi:hypothetical protein